MSWMSKTITKPPKIKTEKEMRISQSHVKRWEMIFWVSSPSWIASTSSSPLSADALMSWRLGGWKEGKQFLLKGNLKDFWGIIPRAPNT